MRHIETSEIRLRAAVQAEQETLTAATACLLQPEQAAAVTTACIWLTFGLVKMKIMDDDDRGRNTANKNQ